MKKIILKFTVTGLLICTGFLPALARAETVKPAPNGIERPKHYKNWRIIGTAHREDNNTLRIILGNSAAIKAVQEGSTNPWPDGAVMAKLVWKDRKNPYWAAATVPGNLVHTEFMIKDGGKYSTTGGWGFARWKGMQQEPYGEDADFAQECFQCHTTAKHNDFVFTLPAPLP